MTLKSLSQAGGGVTPGTLLDRFVSKEHVFAGCVCASRIYHVIASKEVIK